MKTKSLYAHTFFYSVRFLLNKCLTELPPIQYIYIFSLDDFIYYIYNFYYRKLVVCGLFFFVLWKPRIFHWLTCSYMYFWYSHCIISQCLLFLLLVFFFNVYFLFYLLFFDLSWYKTPTSLLINRNGCDSSGMIRSSISYLLELMQFFILSSHILILSFIS